MMKKLLILMLVLGLATAANATLTGIYLSVNGNTITPGSTTGVTMNVCTTMDVDVGGPANYNWLGYAVIMGPPGSAGGEWGDNGNVNPNGYPNAGYYINANYPIVNAGGLGYAHRYVEWNGSDDDWGFGYELSAAWPPPTHAPGGTEFDLAYHCSGTGDVLIQLFDSNVGYDPASAQDTIIVHQIPEPITLTLLGLGGLLLRRRK
jgi:hypothetical protein